MKIEALFSSRRNRIFVKSYGFLLLAQNTGKNIGKNVSRNLSSKYSQKLLDHTKHSATDALKTSSRRLIQKAAEASGDLTGNKIVMRITKVSKHPPQNNSETVIKEHDKEISKERYISPEERQKIIDNLRLI